MRPLFSHLPLRKKNASKIILNLTRFPFLGYSLSRSSALFMFHEWKILVLRRSDYIVSTRKEKPLHWTLYVIDDITGLHQLWKPNNCLLQDENKGRQEETKTRGDWVVTRLALFKVRHVRRWARLENVRWRYLGQLKVIEWNLGMKYSANI